MTYISKEKIDEIKSHNDIVDVIGSYINLNSSNKALCPFHTEKTPSFSVSKEKQIFRCFSGNCGKSGNVINFIMEYDHVPFNEALKILADRAGIPLDIATTKKTNKEFEKYYKINETSNDYFKNNLLSVDGKEAMNYLLKRGLTKELINEFNIGLASSNKLNLILKSKKYDELDSVELGLLKEYNNKYIDTFINKIIFPLLDEQGNVLGFSGRKYLNSELDNKEIPKYSNTKETKIFKKSSILYNLNNAKTYIVAKKEIILVEGYMDAIRVYSIGYKNVVALMGTAFTKEHLEKIMSLKCSVVLNLDQDDPGRVSTINIGHELIKNGIEDVSVIIFDKYKDSDEYINKEGKEAFDISYNNKLPFIDFELKYLKHSRNMKDTTEKSKYINSAIDSINKLNDDILKELKIKELSEEFGIDESVIKSKIVIKNNNQKTKEIPIEIKKYNKYDISEIRILYLMLNNDNVIDTFENQVGSLIHNNMSLLAYKIVEFRNDYGYFTYNDFMDYIRDNEETINTIDEIMRYPNNEEYTEKELDEYVTTIKEYSIQKRINELKKEMRETLDINKKIEIAKKIENINKEVLEW